MQPAADEGASIAVPAGPDETPLLEFLSGRLINESKTTLRRLIGSGAVLLNGRAVRPTSIVRAGDVVALPPGLDEAPPPEQSVPIEVLYEDEAHLCVNKPAGYTVLPGRGGWDAEYFQSLVAVLNAGARPGGPFLRPHVIHRLDRQTSGVLLVAKSVEAGRALSRQFEDRQIGKTYRALVEGVLPRRELAIDIPIGRQEGHLVKMRPDPKHGRPASTRVGLAEPFGHFSLLDVHPLTGRQHQIRVHLAAVGYPLAIDRLYGRRDVLRGADLNAILGAPTAAPDEMLLDRCPLHAASIGYRHPFTGEPLRHEAPLPADLAALLDRLRRCDRPA